MITKMDTVRTDTEQAGKEVGRDEEGIEQSVG